MGKRGKEVLDKKYKIQNFYEKLIKMYERVNKTHQ